MRVEHHPTRFISLMAIALFGSMIMMGCGGGATGSGGGSGSGSNPNDPPPPPVQVQISPTNVNLHAGETQQFSVQVSNASTANVKWSVQGTVGGNATVGTISTTGLYTAPMAVPGTNPVEIKALSTADNKTSATGSVKIALPRPKITAVSPNIVPVGNFTLNLTGSNFDNGAVVMWGAQALPTTRTSSTQVSATGLQSSASGLIAVTVVNPDPSSGASLPFMVQAGTFADAPSAKAAARLLQQTSWGPTQAMVDSLQTIDAKEFIRRQYGIPGIPYSAVPKDGSVANVQVHFLDLAISGNDQLRQRVAFALSQIFVASANKVTDPNGMVLWQNMFQKDAFGNYYDLLKDVTLSPVMGNFLDMANNDKPVGTTKANENYAREVLQLFSIGLAQLNPDGTPQLDGSGNPIPTYGQDEIVGFAHVFTGWTYPPKSGNATFGEGPYYSGPMVGFDSHHDTNAKLVLNGVVIPAGGTAQSDLDAGLQNIFNHPNVGPFIGKNLIQHLVTSNPSPEYVARVTAAFNDNGSGVRGDLKAVINAVLLDPEARRGDDPAQVQANDGHLKEPVLFVLNMARALNVKSYDTCLVDWATKMKQQLMFPPSVFNFYSPQFQIQGSDMQGPEFQIFDNTTTVARVNFVDQFVYGGGCGSATTDISNWTAMAGTPDQMVDKMAALMLHGNMSDQMRSSVLATVTSISDSKRRAQAALYLIGSSTQFQVEH